MKNQLYKEALVVISAVVTLQEFQHKKNTADLAHSQCFTYLNAFSLSAFSQRNEIVSLPLLLFFFIWFSFSPSTAPFWVLLTSPLPFFSYLQLSVYQCPLSLFSLFHQSSGRCKTTLLLKSTGMATVNET